MNLVILSSVMPSFGHFRAGQTVLAVLAQALADNDNINVKVAVTRSASSDVTIFDALDNAEFELIDSHSFATEPELVRKSWLSKIKLLFDSVSKNPPRLVESIVDKDAALRSILNQNPDAVLLFWDSAFEDLVPRLAAESIKTFGYLARPPYAAAEARVALFQNPLKRSFYKAIYRGAYRKHLKNLSQLEKSGNICALDASYYTRNKVQSKYIPNTWPDAYGQNWKELRRKAESRKHGLHILGNIGGLNATGNFFGMNFFCDEVLPILSNRLPHPWNVNICGRFALPDVLQKKLDHPNVTVRGFVDDINEEVIGNEIFLLLNNAGPYTGGYTRVMFAFAAGACLIAHSNLAKSMPELIHRHNCLLGDNGPEIADLIHQASEDPTLRANISGNARKTYDNAYKPSRVATQLIDMILAD